MQNKAPVFQDALFIDDYFIDGMVNAKIVRANCHQGQLDSIYFPDKNNCGVITAADLPTKNNFSPLISDMPLLASELISYSGQPIAICYGEDENELDDFLQFGEISYSHVLPHSPVMDKHKKLSKYIQTDSKIPATDNETLQIDYSIKSNPIYQPGHIGAVAYGDPQKEWTLVCSSRNSLLISAVLNELFVGKLSRPRFKAALCSPIEQNESWLPALIAYYAVVVWLKTGRSCKLILQKKELLCNCKLETESQISFSTEIEQQKITNITISANFFCGAFQWREEFLIEEFLRTAKNIFPVKIKKINVKLFTTNSPPLSLVTTTISSQLLTFFQMFLYSVTEKLNLEPLAFWENMVFQSSSWLGAKKDQIIELLERIIDLNCRQSNFYRRNSAYRQEKKEKNQLFPRQLFQRGIGGAVSFFHNELSPLYSDLYDYNIECHFHSRENFEIICNNFIPPPKIRQIMVDQIRSLLSIKKEAVTISCGGDSREPLLSNLHDILLPAVMNMVTDACHQLASRWSSEKLPLTQRCRYSLFQKRSSQSNDAVEFRNCSWGMATIEIKYWHGIQECEIKNIFLTISCGRMKNNQTFVDFLKSIVLTELLRINAYFQKNWADGSVSPFLRKIYSGDIKVDIIENKATDFTPVNGLVRTILTSAYLNAVSQSLNKRITRIPFQLEPDNQQDIEDNNET